MVEVGSEGYAKMRERERWKVKTKGAWSGFGVFMGAMKGEERELDLMMAVGW